MSFPTLGFSEEWFSWGLALIIGFPLIVVILGELIHRLERAHSPWHNIVRFIQRFIVPQLVLLLITTRILEMAPDHLLVKIIETLLWIFIIYAAISALNLLLFTESENSWRIKIPKLLQDMGRIVIVALGSALVLSNVWGFELGKMLAALGVGSIVLGLALQDTFSSLFSGFSLLSSNQFRVGDWLQVDDHIGQVTNVNWHSVTLLNRDEDIIIIPNSDLAKGKFINYSHPYPRHTERVNFDFSFDDAPHKVKYVLLQAAADTDDILTDPAPKVFLTSYDEFSVRHQILFSIRHYRDLPRIRDSFLSRVWYIAQREGITFPTRAHEVFVMPTPESQHVSEQSRILEVMKQSPLLHDKDSDILHNIAKHAQILPYGTDEKIIHQGVHSNDFFIMLSGEAVEYYQDAQGKRHRLNTLAEGEVLGLISLVRNSPDEVTVVTQCDAEVIRIQEKYAHLLLHRHPELTVIIEKIIETQQQELRSIDTEVQNETVSS